MKKVITYPIYLLLLPVFYVLHHNNELFGFISLRLSLIAFLICCAGLVLLFGSYYLVNRSVERSSLYTFNTGIFIIYFGVCHDFLKDLFQYNWLSSYKVVLPILIALLVLISRLISKRPSRLRKVQLYLNVLFLILIIVEIGGLAWNLIRIQKDKNLIEFTSSVVSTYKGATIAEKPDIYFLIFDGYPSNRVLQKYWQFNNDSISDWLKEKQFHIVEDSKANYNFTVFSISSILNMAYISSKMELKGNKPVIELKAAKSISESETFKILSKEGYSIKIFAPFGNQQKETGLNNQFKTFSLREFYSATLPARFIRDLIWHFKGDGSATAPGFNIEQAIDSSTYKSVNLTIQKLMETTDTSNSAAPHFVYGHFMITHEPHLIHSDQTIGKKYLGFSPENDAGYVFRIRYANSVIRNVVAGIMQHNRKNTVLIVQGDHGFRNFSSASDPEQFSNFEAIYFADANYAQLNGQLSSVNLFRIIFNKYFGQEFSLLKDSSIVVKY
jgi:Sulfatase